MKRILLALLLPIPVLAQPPEVQRSLLQRDQQSSEFSLQLRQSQERVPPGPGDNRHLNERQRLENVGAQQQLQAVAKDAPPEQRPYERQKAADERIFSLAPPEIRAPARKPPRDLPEMKPFEVTPVGPAY